MLDFELPPVDSLLALPRRKKRRSVLFVTMPDGDPFDLIAPMTVLREANFFIDAAGRSDLLYDLEVVSNQVGVIFEVDGLQMCVTKTCYEAQQRFDTVVFQAVDYAGDCLRDEKFIAWVQSVSKRSRRLVTACIGTYVLAEAGLLNGHRAATHWSAAKDFRQRYPKVLLDDEPIYIRDGKFYTSAGVTSILDLMLALVEEDLGSELALRVAQGMVMFLRRPANQAQFSVQLTGLGTEDQKIRGVLRYVTENPEANLAVERLAELANMSPRNFARIFSREIGMTPGKFVERYRLESARRQLEQTGWPVNIVAQKCGYQSTDGMRLAFDRNLGVTPREYRARFCGSTRGIVSLSGASTPGIALT